MGFSSYQIGRLLAHFRLWRGLNCIDTANDPVAVSAEATARSGSAAVPPVPRGGSPAHVADRRVYPPIVEEELERRAGSFMDPKYPEQSPSSRIPRVPAKAPDQVV